MDIKIRLLKLGKRQLDLLQELRKRGQQIQSSELSAFINGYIRTPKAGKILELCNEILTIWEKEG